MEELSGICNGVIQLILTTWNITGGETQEPTVFVAAAPGQSEMAGLEGTHVNVGGFQDDGEVAGPSGAQINFGNNQRSVIVENVGVDMEAESPEEYHGIRTTSDLEGDDGGIGEQKEGGDVDGGDESEGEAHPPPPPPQAPNPIRMHADTLRRIQMQILVEATARVEAMARESQQVKSTEPEQQLPPGIVFRRTCTSPCELTKYIQKMETEPIAFMQRSKTESEKICNGLMRIINAGTSESTTLNGSAYHSLLNIFEVLREEVDKLRSHAQSCSDVSIRQAEEARMELIDTQTKKEKISGELRVAQGELRILLGRIEAMKGDHSENLQIMQDFHEQMVVDYNEAKGEMVRVLAQLFIVQGEKSGLERNMRKMREEHEEMWRELEGTEKKLGRVEDELDRARCQIVEERGRVEAMLRRALVSEEGMVDLQCEREVMKGRMQENILRLEEAREEVREKEGRIWDMGRRYEEAQRGLERYAEVQRRIVENDPNALKRLCWGGMRGGAEEETASSCGMGGVGFGGGACNSGIARRGAGYAPCYSESGWTPSPGVTGFGRGQPNLNTCQGRVNYYSNGNSSDGWVTGQPLAVSPCRWATYSIGACVGGEGGAPPAYNTLCRWAAKTGGPGPVGVGRALTAIRIPATAVTTGRHGGVPYNMTPAGTEVRIATATVAGAGFGGASSTISSAGNGGIGRDPCNLTTTEMEFEGASSTMGPSDTGFGGAPATMTTSGGGIIESVPLTASEIESIQSNLTTTGNNDLPWTTSKAPISNEMLAYVIDAVATGSRYLSSTVTTAGEVVTTVTNTESVPISMEQGPPAKKWKLDNGQPGTLNIGLVTGDENSGSDPGSENEGAAETNDDMVTNEKDNDVEKEDEKDK